MQVVSTIPLSGATLVSLLPEIKIVFDKTIDANTVDDSSVTLSTNKTNILVIKDTIPQPEGVFATDDFFTDAFTGIVQGKITTDDCTLTFKPTSKLQSNTLYTVSISNTIADTAGNMPAKIAVFSFTTREEDMTEEIVVPIPTTTVSIIGSNVVFANDTDITTAGMYVESTSPKADSFLITGKDISVTFSLDVSAQSLSKIIVYAGNILSDEQPTVVDADISINSVDDKTVDIVLPDDIELGNVVISIFIKKGFASENGSLMPNDYAFSYVAKLDPYYSSTKLLRLVAGTVLTGITDIALALSIYYASEEAYQTVGNRVPDEKRRTILRQKLTLYTALYNILVNNYAFSGIHDYVKKELGDFSLAVSSKERIKLYNSLVKDTKDSIAKIKSLLAYGYANPFFKRSSNHINSDIGRMWDRYNPGVNSRFYEDSKYILGWEGFDAFTWHDTITYL